MQTEDTFNSIWKSTMANWGYR